LLQKRIERPQQRGLPKGMVKLDSRYSIFDRRNFCEITGVTPNGLKRHANRGTGRGRTIRLDRSAAHATRMDGVSPRAMLPIIGITL
jgi:hypothetical protein